MKRILTALITISAFLSFNDLNATHIAGGEISYRYIGDSTGINYQYLVRLYIYRDNTNGGGAGLPASATLCYTSSCFTGGSVNFNRITPPAGQADGDGGFTIPTLDECVDNSAANWVQISQHRYEGVITLDGKCADWKFFWQSCCRNFAITNLTAPGSQGFVILAELNNVLGPNNSPRFITPAAKAFCANQPFTWRQSSVEPDGDSTSTDFGAPLDNTFGCTNTNWTQIPFAAGYSVNSPMTTANGIQVDAKTGTFRFTPTQAEVDVMKVDVTEYRFDTTLLQWIVVGKVTRELQVPIFNNCSPQAEEGPTIDVVALGSSGLPVPTSTLQAVKDSLKGYGIADIYIDSTNGMNDHSIPIIPYTCFDSIITLKFDPKTKVDCESISPDGTDFRLVGPDSIPRPIVGVIPNCDAEFTANEIKLVLHKPLDVNGTYIFYIKQGSDGNTLTNRCGFELPEFYAMVLDVKDCPILNYRLDNVSVFEDRFINIDWWADASTFAPHLFAGWNILRANNDNNYYIVETVNDVNARSYQDTNGLEVYTVDQQIFQYKVQLVQNFDFKTPTNDINSIRLRDTVNEFTNTIDLSWNPYNGWATPSYELFLGKKDTSTNQIAWANYAGPSNSLFTSTYNIPEPSATTEGIFAWKVEASDPVNSGPFISESNWLFFEILYDKDPPPAIPGEVYIPNIMTPNGDELNDIFYVQELANPYPTIEVSVYNRWGQLVFEDTQFKLRNNEIDGWDGTDMNSGQKLADGVYYYVVRLYDGVTGTELNKQGSVTLMGGTN